MRIKSSYKPRSGADAPVDVAFSGEPLRLPPNWTIDIELGAGHGGDLVFYRFASSRDEVSVEEVVWKRAYPRGGIRPEGTARRARMTRADCAAFLETLCLVPTVELVQHDPQGSGGLSSASRFYLLRVLSDDGQVLFERSLSSSRSDDRQGDFLSLEVACAVAYEVLPDEATRWTHLAPDQLRQSHFASAFVLNEEAMLIESYWYMMEGSVEALGCFGTAEVVPALAAVRKREGLQRRQIKKIDAVLSSPDHWLAGPPKYFD